MLVKLGTFVLIVVVFFVAVGFGLCRWIMSNDTVGKSPYPNMHCITVYVAHDGSQTITEPCRVGKDILK